MSYYNIDESRLTKYNLIEQIHVENGEGLKIINDVENKFLIIGNNIDRYQLDIYNKDTDKLVESRILLNGQGIQIAKFNYQAVLKKNDQIIQNVSFDTTGKKIMLHLDSHCLGDTLAWMAYVKDYFYKNNASELVVTNFWNQLFESPHISIKLVDHYDNEVDGIYSIESLGYKKETLHKQKNLQQVICDLMKIPYVEKRPLMKIPKCKIPDYGKYVCITENATDISKTWLYPNGWQIIVDYLNNLGYKVVVISKETTKLKNIIDQTNRTIEKTSMNLMYCEFFIGLASGLSWLAWAFNKRVIMISGFSLPYTEFSDKNYRIINSNVCHGCWNDINIISSVINNHCPKHFNTERQYECSKQITPEIIMNTINYLI